MLKERKPGTGDTNDLSQSLAEAEVAVNKLRQLYLQDDQKQMGETFDKVQGILKKLSQNLDERKVEAGPQTMVSDEIEQLYEAIFECSPYALSLTKVPEGSLVGVNDAFLKLFGFSRQQVIGKTSSELEITDEASRALLAEEFNRSGFVHDFECLRKKKNGEQLTVSLNLDWVSVDGQKYVLTTIRDITGYRLTQQALDISHLEVKSERNRLQAVMEALPVGVAILDSQGGNIQANHAFDQIWGGTRPKITSIDEYDIFKAWWIDNNQPVKPEEWASAQAVQKGITVCGQVMKIQRFDGTYTYIHNSAAPIFDGQGNISGCAVAIQEISEQRQREEEINRLNRTLRALNNSSQAMLHSVDEQEFLSKVCNIIVQDCSYAMVWIGYAEDDEQKSVRPVASAGFEQGYLDSLHITWADTQRGNGPTGVAIRTGKPARCNNMLSDPKFAPWREAAVQQGYASSIVLPLLADGRAFGALNIYSSEPNGFSPEEEKLLMELADDLAYGITHLRLKAETEHAEKALMQARDELEVKVQERTKELSIAVSQLNNEIIRRQGVQEELETSLLELQVLEEELRNNNETLVEAQKVLDIERQRYQDLFDFSPDGYFVTDSNGKIIEANQVAYNMLKIAHRNLIGKPLLVFVSKPNRLVFNRLLNSIQRTQDPKSHEFNLIPRKGPPLIASIRVISVSDREGKGIFRWTMRDITDRKHNEEIIRQNAERNAILSEVAQSLAEASLDEKAILEVIAEISVRLIGDGCMIAILSEDEQWLEPVAWHHTNPATHQLMDTLCASWHQKVTSEPYGKVVSNPQPVLMKAITADQGKEIFPKDYHPYLDQIGISSLMIMPLTIRGQVIGVISLTRDDGGTSYNEGDLSVVERLTSRSSQSIQNARLYHELQVAMHNELEVRKQLIQAEKFAAVGRLLASITHEINNPLQTIKNCLYLSQIDSTPGTQAYDTLNMAVTETNRLSDLVAQLRQIYRPPTVSMHQTVDLLSLLAETRTLLASYLQEKHTTWQLSEPAPGLLDDVIVEGAPDQLKQVFLNISLNAVDAMEPDGGTITISLDRSSNGLEVGVCFKDTGPGMPQELKDSLFEPFITTKEKGMGLGLTICYDIIHKHNGHIQVSSEPGDGAAFTVWLPIKQGAE